MKKIFVESIMKYIKKNTTYDNNKLEIIEYGIVGIYLTLSKIIIIISLSFVLGIFKEVIIFMLIFNIIRSFAFGLHATKSWICLLSSTAIFIGLPLICLYTTITFIPKLIILIILSFFILKNAPADTYKRPIVSKKRRTIYKILSVTISIIFGIISLYINNNFISNCLLYSLVLENCLISPSIYKIFKLPYNNYIAYLQKHPDFLN